MTKRQENRLSMARAVQDILQQHTNVVNTIPAFVAARLELDQLITEANGLVQIQVEKTKGVSQDKKQAETQVIRAALKLAGPTKSYAIAQMNNALRESVSYSQSQLNNMRDTTLVSVLGTIRNKVSLIMSQLVPYGVSAADLTAFDTALADYNAMVAAPRNNTTSKTWATEQLDNVFKKIDLLLKQTDGIAQLKKETEAEFFVTYSSARKVVDNAGKGAASGGDTPDVTSVDS